MGHGMVNNILKKQRLEIEEVIDTIHDNINQLRSDLEICLIKLKGILFGLMEDHFHDIKFLADKLGGDHPMISILEQEGDQLIDSVNETIYLTDTLLRDAESDWEGYGDAVCEEHPAQASTTAHTDKPEENYAGIMINTSAQLAGE